jgi:RimJ/RimL family protein N-acetyltransferase
MTASEYWLTTERLGLRRFTLGDLGWFAAMYADPDVTRYLGGRKSRTQAEALLHTRILRYYDEHPGLGIWVTIERATGAPLGFHVLNHIQGESIVQVGFILAKPAWGRGVATEMGVALLRYGFADLGLPRIAGMAELGNLASQRVLEKIGLHRHGERAFSHPAYAAQGPMAWYERDAADWLAERGSRHASSFIAREPGSAAARRPATPDAAQSRRRSRTS